jgi:hypothetical protein
VRNRRGRRRGHGDMCRGEIRRTRPVAPAARRSTVRFGSRRCANRLLIRGWFAGLRRFAGPRRATATAAGAAGCFATCLALADAIRTGQNTRDRNTCGQQESRDSCLSSVR